MEPSAIAPSADIDVTAAANLLFKGIESGNWWLILGPVVALLVWALREKIAPTFPKVNEFLQQPIPALLSPIVVAALGGLLTILAAGPVSKTALLGLVPVVLKVAFTAISSFVGMKKVTEHREQAKANAAAAVPADVQDAAAALNAPPIAAADTKPSDTSKA